MVTFIEDVLIDIQENGLEFSELTFILPSKRAGNFLKRSLAELSNKTIFSPEILSIEEFVDAVSLLKPISNTELLFQFYAIYQSLTPKDQIESFDNFCKWAQIILQDFNEIDRYLISEDQIFNYLTAIKEVNHWSLDDKKTDLIKNYLSFWKTLPQYYNGLKDVLLQHGLGYQGLIYKEAVNKLELYIQHNPKKQHIFLGFNALNTAEQTIIQELLQQDLANIYWDIDQVFLRATYHDTGLFLRKYKQWHFFQKQPFKWENQHYKTKKIFTLLEFLKILGKQNMLVSY